MLCVLLVNPTQDRPPHTVEANRFVDGRNESIKSGIRRKSSPLLFFSLSSAHCSAIHNRSSLSLAHSLQTRLTFATAKAQPKNVYSFFIDSRSDTSRNIHFSDLLLEATTSVKMVNAKVIVLSALAGLVAAGEYAEPPHPTTHHEVTTTKTTESHHSKPTTWSHHGNNTVVTTTKVVSRYTTWCPEPTTVCIGSKTYTVTKPTTLTVTDCPCTITEVSGPPSLRRCLLLSGKAKMMRYVNAKLTARYRLTGPPSPSPRRSSPWSPPRRRPLPRPSSPQAPSSLPAPRAAPLPTASPWPPLASSVPLLCKRLEARASKSVGWVSRSHARLRSWTQHSWLCHSLKLMSNTTFVSSSKAKYMVRLSAGHGGGRCCSSSVVARRGPLVLPSGFNSGGGGNPDAVTSRRGVGWRSVLGVVAYISREGRRAH